MPVMPSFTGFAGTPDLGGAFNQGRAIADRAREAQQQLQVQQQKIAMEQQNAAMEMEVKQKQLQQQSLRDQQEIQVQNAYKEQMLGMQQREVAVKEQMLNMGVQKAARSFQANQSYQKEAADMIAAGMEPDKAFMQAALKWGPEMDLPGAAYTQAFKQPKESVEDFGKATDVEGLDPGKYKKFRTGEGSFQLVTLPQGMEEGGAPEGYMKFGNRVIPERESIEVRDAKQERNRLVKLQDSDIPGQLAFQEAQSEGAKAPSKAKKVALDRYETRQRQIKELESRIAPSRKSQSKFQEGATIRSKKDGKLYIVKDGVPQPAE